MLIVLVLGCVLALAIELGEKTAFAKKYKTFSTFGWLAVIIAAGYAVTVISHVGSMWIMLLCPFWGLSKIKESRQKSRAAKQLYADLSGQVQSALAERTGTEAVEIDVTRASETTLWTLINTNKKKGLTVETVKNQSTGAVKLRLSGSITDGK